MLRTECNQCLIALKMIDAIRELIELFLTNQIAENTIDFKMNM